MTNLDYNNILTNKPDFHTSDTSYIYICTLNVCATQELYIIIQKQEIIINDLKKRIETLEYK
jgi:hypothetical protein